MQQGQRRKAFHDESAEPVRSNYITPEGMERIRMELKELWEIERPKVTQAVSDAAALGDRSENAEYLYGKKKLREIDRRLIFLKRRIEKLVVVPPNPALVGKVFFGAWVRLQHENGSFVQYRIVGPDEIDLDSGKISMDSPLGKAMMRKSVGETVVVKRPIGDITYTVVAVQYEEFGPIENDLEVKAKSPKTRRKKPVPKEK